MPATRTKPRDPASQWLVLEPNRIEKQYWNDLWRYRELFAILAWRDITVCIRSSATSKRSSVWPGP
jgi:lipopolysaccharide transport system permease protein